MMMKLRPYQKKAVEAVYKYLREHDDNPCVVLPTGTGKSLVLGKIATEAVTRWNGRVLILAHVKELLEQNADKIRRLYPEVEIGIYSAGLKRRDTDTPVLIGGIQSVYQRACELGPFNLIIVDEAHLVPTDGEGMYRTFIQDARKVNPAVRVIGMTATPYRLKGGEICRPENILNSVCYEAGLREMIHKGYLCKLRSRGGKTKADFSDLHVRGGEFIASEMADAMDRNELVSSACREIVELTADRRSVLIFTASVAHCQHVSREISRISGHECGMVIGETSAIERDRILSRFRNEAEGDELSEKESSLKFLANVNVLTTGFNATNIDCIVLLRPTMSAGLYVQMVGRGTRLHPGKEDCRVLDYGGNVLRHGPVDAVQVRPPGQGGGEPLAKECSQCGELVHAAYQVCPECGAEFPPPPESPPHEAHADESAILSGENTDTEYEVKEVHYSVHTKRGADENHPKSMRVEYAISWACCKSEWVCPGHKGWARQKFKQWWSRRSRVPLPTSAAEAVRLAKDGALADTHKITVRSAPGKKFDEVIAHEVGDRPEYYPGPAPDDCRDEEKQLGTGLSLEDDDIPF